VKRLVLFLVIATSSLAACADESSWEPPATSAEHDIRSVRAEPVRAYKTHPEVVLIAASRFEQNGTITHEGVGLWLAPRVILTAASLLTNQTNFQIRVWYDPQTLAPNVSSVSGDTPLRFDDFWSFSQ